MHKATGSLAPLLLALPLLVAGCGGGEEGAASSDSSSDGPAASQYGGTFTATLGPARYEVPVQCTGLGEEYFEFRSDRSDASDTDGDGYVISGMQNGEKLILTLIDHGTTWSTPNLGEWSMDGTTATGTGQMYKDGGDNRTREASFRVDCG